MPLQGKRVCVSLPCKGTHQTYLAVVSDRPAIFNSISS